MFVVRVCEPLSIDGGRDRDTGIGSSRGLVLAPVLSHLNRYETLIG